MKTIFELHANKETFEVFTKEDGKTQVQEVLTLDKRTELEDLNDYVGEYSSLHGIEKKDIIRKGFELLEEEEAKMTNLRAILDQDTNFLIIEEEENGAYVWRDVFSISRNFGILDVGEAEACIEMYLSIHEIDDVHVERVGMEQQQLSIPVEDLGEVGMRLDDFVGEHIFLDSEEEYGVRISPSGNVYLSIFYSTPYIREVSDTNESPLNFCNHETVIMDYDLRENTGFFRYRSRMPEMAIDYLEEALIEISRAIVW